MLGNCKYLERSVSARTAFFSGFDLFFPFIQKKEKKISYKGEKGSEPPKKTVLDFRTNKSKFNLNKILC